MIKIIPKIKVFNKANHNELETEMNEYMRKNFAYPFSDNMLSVEVKREFVPVNGFTWVGVIKYNYVVEE